MSVPDEMLAEQVSRPEFLRFVEKRLIKSTCEVCGEAHGWSVPEGHHNMVVGLFMPRPGDGGYVMPGGIAPAIIMVCNNCAHIRFFSEVFVKTLLAQMK